MTKGLNCYLNAFKSGKGEQFYVVLVPGTEKDRFDVVNVRSNGQVYSMGQEIKIAVNASVRFVNAV